MFGEITIEIMLLLMLYAVGATMAAVACLYLVFRRGNAFSPRVKTPKRLRQWTAAFFGTLALGHVWYMPAAVLTDSDAITLTLLIGGLLDCMLTVPLAIVVLLCMLQDRRRPLWPIWVAMSPLIILMAVSVGLRSYAMLPWLRGYLLLLGIGFTVYMVREVRRYGRWLRDNYADLEHKEVWQSFVVLAVIVLMFAIYACGATGVVYEYVIQVCGILLICYLLWRVETLSSLTAASSPNPLSKGKEGMPSAGETSFEEIGLLLKQRCEDTKLYLKHDLTAIQLAKALGTNRYYLSQYFSHNDTTYNTYINGLRIDYFLALYREESPSDQPVSAKQLASRSGYRSYSTFSLAFKQRMGQSVTAWIPQQSSSQQANKQ